MRIPHLLFLLLASICLYVSCSQESTCLVPQTVALRSKFVSRDTGSTVKDSVLKNANIYIGSGFTYFSNIKNSSSFLATLSQSSDMSLFVFQPDSNVQSVNAIDSFFIYYQRKLRFLSTACGYQTNFEIDSVRHTSRFVDSIRITNRSVGSEVNNVHLFIILKK